MAFCKNHDHIYFDKLCRTKKAETVLSLIYATNQAKKNCGGDKEKEKQEIAKHLVSAYQLFKFDSGTYTGSYEQFQSQYTIGHELGIWSNSDLDLAPLAQKVADGKITIKEYFDIVFLNYIQPINDKIYHPLYSVLLYMKNNNLDSIEDSDIAKSFVDVNNRSEDIRGLHQMLIGTSYFMEIDGKLKIQYPIDDILSCCNTEYLGNKGLEVSAKFSELSDYLNYLHKDNRSSKILLQRSGMAKKDMENNKKTTANNPKIGGENWIYYGAPGCGKSHKIKNDLQFVNSENIFRVTFHPEYTNSDFVGQILPTITKDDEGNDEVKYIFNAGPFTKSLERALTTNESVYLIIEEINRGNAASIFGDIFQLLDRQKAEKEDGTPNEEYGRSEYDITNPNIEDYLKEKINLPENFKVYIPRNMSVWATMNSSDQNVFTLDTAFKRRWNFKQIPNDIKSDANHKYKMWYIPGTDVTWEKFLSAINPSILDYKIRNHTNEDKQLGKYFVGPECLTKDVMPITNEECNGKAEQFAYKVLEYLWNDVCKIDKDEWFDTNVYRTLEDLISGFTNPKANQNPLSVFKGIDFTK